MPFFSVIISLYNKENFIENTLKSVINQRFVDFEIIIINDGSTDSSAEKVKQFVDSRIRYYYKDNGGVSTARNYGIELAKSNFITFLDADDYWYPEFLEQMFENIYRFPEQMVFSAATEIESSNKVFPSKYSISKTGDFEIVNYFSASLKESVIWTSCAVFHKSVFEKSGVFDPTIKISEDTDLWIRIGLDYSILFSWKILARYVYDSESISRNYNYIMEESTFFKYKNQEIENKLLNKFLDLNRFSMAIKSKVNGDNISFRKYKTAIKFENIGIKKQILLYMPGFVLKRLICFKNYFTGIGLGNSVFK
jgi:glycosyltransferase involved in cell wall biosynthesis